MSIRLSGGPGIFLSTMSILCVVIAVESDARWLRDGASLLPNDVGISHEVGAWGDAHKLIASRIAPCASL